MTKEIPGTISTVTIRNAVVADVPAMVRIASAVPQAAQWSEAQYFDLFTPDRIMLVVEYDSTVSGFLAARCSGEEYEIENIVISGALQRQGLGTKLLKELIRITGENHPAKVFLEVRESNAGARALYAKLGFRKIGERKNYYHNPTESAWNYELVIP